MSSRPHRGSVQGREQRSGVDHQRHQDGGCATGSLATSAAERPSVELATPKRGRREACSLLAFSSIASAISADSDTPRRRASAASVSSDARLAATA
jgi:hypothetical protein